MTEDQRDEVAAGAIIGVILFALVIVIITVFTLVAYYYHPTPVVDPSPQENPAPSSQDAYPTNNLPDGGKG